MNLDFYINMAFSVLIGLLQHQIPNNADNQNKFKKAFVKVARLLGQAYKDDKDIQNAFAGKSDTVTPTPQK